jgi:hypothetical protein
MQVAKISGTAPRNPTQETKIFAFRGTFLNGNTQGKIANGRAKRRIKNPIAIPMPAY